MYFHAYANCDESLGAITVTWAQLGARGLTQLTLVVRRCVSPNGATSLSTFTIGPYRSSQSATQLRCMLPQNSSRWCANPKYLSAGVAPELDNHAGAGPLREPTASVTEPNIATRATK